ncbi:MAG: 7-cyano-7-deazaguanine synthase QueC [Patescibacteria group bacterium]
MKTVLVFSGGMDSTTLLHKLLRQAEAKRRLINNVAVGHNNDGDTVSCLSFDYGQRHKKELNCARNICRELKVPHKIVDIKKLKTLMAGSALTADVAVPEGHYKDKTMRATVVPNRNMIFLALAIAQAVSLKYDRVAIAVHAGDHAIYPDCRPEFIAKMNAVSRIANYESVQIYAPFLNMTKRQIAKLGQKLKVDYSKTWTCYKGLKWPCKKCGACRERMEALSAEKR